MSIESKMAYRTGFLQSETWKDIRYAKMVRDGMNCDICGVKALTNDAHHVHYPKKWEDTSSGDLIILCRDCHTTIHLFPNTKRNTSQVDSWRHYLSVRDKVKEHRRIVKESSFIGGIPIPAAIERLKLLKTRLFGVASKINKFQKLGAQRYLRLTLEGKEAGRLEIKPALDRVAPID